MRKKAIWLAVFLVLFSLFSINFAKGELLSGWNYRIPITITEQSGNNLTDYQVLITIDTQSLISEGKMREDCGDIRFTDSDGITLIPYWIEEGCNSANTRIWVKVPNIPANGQKTIYLYYGNPQAENIGKMWNNITHLGIYGGVFDYSVAKMSGYRFVFPDSTYIFVSNGSCYLYGLDYYNQAEDYYGGDAIAVSVGRFHTCILKSNGNVDCYGYNSYGQAEDYYGGDAIAVSAGTYHTCILKSNGNVDCYGYNSYGQAEDYYGGDAVSVSAGAYHTCILKSNGNVVCYGANSFGEANGYYGGDAIAVSAGEFYTCILKSNGNVDCYGANWYGQAINYTGGDAVAVSAGWYHMCILKSNGNVDCYGLNNWGQANGYYGGDAIAVSVGTYHTCILKSNGNVDCYGYNNWGQGEDYYGGDAVAVSAGYYHTCILKSNGNVDCYGINNYAYFGTDTIYISGGHMHVCALKSNGNVVCYGENSYGQAINYTGGDAVSVSAGAFYTCILKSNGNVDCYGNNGLGQAEDYYGGDAIAVSAGTYHTCILKSNGNVDCYGYNSYGQAEDYYGGDAIAVSVGRFHTCILKSNGNVDCYGYNSYGQAEDYYGGDAIAVSAGTYHTCILKSDGNVVCYGENSYGQAINYTGGDAIAVSAGYSYTCILKSNGNIDCYGFGARGQADGYYGGDAYNPFRKYAYPEPTYTLGEEEIVTYQPPQYPEYCEFVINGQTEINEGGVYCLGSSITIEDVEPIISINSNDVILDCLNNRISSNGKIVIYLNDVNNITVRNCRLYNARIGGTAGNLELYGNVFTAEDRVIASLLNCRYCRAFNNTILSKTNGIIRTFCSLIFDGQYVNLFDNYLYSINFTPVSYGSTDALSIFVFRNAQDSLAYNNYGYSEYNTPGIVVTIASRTARNISIYNNYIYAPNSVLCLQIANCENCYAYNNTHTECLWVISNGRNATNVYVFNNTMKYFIMTSFSPYWISNLYAYNNTLEKIDYSFNIFYGQPFLFDNVYHPATTTLEPYISVVFDYTSLDYGNAFPGNYYDIVKNITINTNRIDYKIIFDSDGLRSGNNIIGKENMMISLSKNDTFDRFYTIGVPITYLKQNLSSTVRINHRLYVPLVSPGLYTGKIYVTYEVGELPNTYFMEDSCGEVELI